MKRILNNFIIISHRRSGTHLLYETLNNNFIIKNPVGWVSDDIVGADRFKMHYTIDNVLTFHSNNIDSFVNKYFCVYIIRDLRDTLVSSWCYWNKQAEKHLGILMGDALKNKTFSEYIRGASDEEAYEYNMVYGDGFATNLLDPITRWIDFTEWANYVYTIRFEDLKVKPLQVIDSFSDNFKIKRKSKDYILVKELVGYLPRKGIVGDWKNFFSKKDMDYVFCRASSVMQKFGYLWE